MEKSIKSYSNPQLIKSNVNIIDNAYYHQKLSNPYSSTINEIPDLRFTQKERPIDDRYDHMLDKSKERITNSNRISTNEQNIGKYALQSPLRSTFTSGYLDNPFETKRSLLNTGKTFQSFKNNSVSKEFDSVNNYYVKLDENMPDFKGHLENKFKNTIKNSTLSSNKYTYSGSSESDIEKNKIKVDKKLQGQKKNSNNSIQVKDLISLKSNNEKKRFNNSKKIDNEFDDSASIVDSVNQEENYENKINKKLKAAIQKQVPIDYEKYYHLKAKAKEMKQLIKEYSGKVKILEQTVQAKEININKLIDQIEQIKKELVNNFDALQESNRKMEIMKKNEEDIKSTNIEYKVKLNEQNRQLNKLEELLRQSDERHDRDTNTLKEDNNQLRNELMALREKESQVLQSNEYYKMNIQQLENDLNDKITTISKLDELNQNLQKDIKELNDRLDKSLHENGQFDRGLEEAKLMISQLQEKNSTIKRKSEDEKIKLVDELQKKLEYKTQKGKLYKAKLKDLEAAYAKQASDNKDLTIELERLSSYRGQYAKELDKLREDLLRANDQITSLKENNRSLRSQNDDIAKNLKSESEKAIGLHLDNKKLVKLLVTNEEKLSHHESEIARYEEINKHLKVEVSDLLEEKIKQKDEISKLEKKLNFTKDEQSDEIAKIEQTVHDLITELKKIKEENQSLKDNQSSILNDLKLYKEKYDKYKKEYKRIKQINNELESDLKEINQKVNEFILEKNQEIQQHRIQGIKSQKQVNPKVKILEEVQDMIRAHRVANKGSFDQSDIA